MENNVDLEVEDALPVHWIFRQRARLLPYGAPVNISERTREVQAFDDLAGQFIDEFVGGM